MIREQTFTPKSPALRSMFSINSSVFFIPKDNHIPSDKEYFLTDVVSLTISADYLPFLSIGLVTKILNDMSCKYSTEHEEANLAFPSRNEDRKDGKVLVCGYGGHRELTQGITSACKVPRGPVLMCQWVESVDPPFHGPVVRHP